MALLRAAPNRPTGYTMAEAAEAAGVDRSSILVSIHTGKIKGTYTELGSYLGAERGWIVEPAELAKVYPLKKIPTPRPPLPIASYLVQFIILTAVRVGQAQYLRWGEIDFDAGVWTCPWHKHKAGRKTKQPHLILLSTAAMKILDEMRARQQASGFTSEFVFVHDATQYPFTNGSAPRTGKTLNQSSLIWLVRRTLPERDDVTVHGFRTNFSSWAYDHGFPRDDIEMALGHVVGNQVERIYARNAKRLESRRRLMEAWAEYCSRTEPIAGDVILFRQAK
jgi:integrase